MLTNALRALWRAWLLVLSHLAGLMRSPKAYLTAAKWRVLGKRVRARGQFAALLARTSRAYDLWVLTRGAQSEPSGPGRPTIIALVEEGRVRADAQATISSLSSEGLESYKIDHANPIDDLKRAALAIDWSEPAWLLPIQAGDQLAPGAARAYRDAMTSEATLIYGDDDKLTERNIRKAPHFKSDWNPDLFANHDFLTGACLVRGDRVGLEAAAQRQDWARALVDFALADGVAPVHVRRMLHHRRKRPAPALALAPVPIEPDQPLVSVIVPTRNRVDLLATCIEGLRATQYPAIEVIVVDNDSDDSATLDFLAQIESDGITVLRHPGAFNYPEINNRAVDEASGDLICLLNNDIEMRKGDWLAIMVAQALRKDVGAVGAQLLYPDGRIQHAGVVIGVGNAAAHAHRLLQPNEPGYFQRHNLPQFVSAVTAACLVVGRDKFLAVGGLDPVNFPVAFNDVDLCLKLNQRGWQSFYEPRAVLVHHESVSRGLDHDPAGAARFARELGNLQRLWKTDRVTDPYHHPELSRATEQFSVGLHNV